MNWILVRLLDRGFTGLHEQYVQRDLISTGFNYVVMALGDSQENWSDNGDERDQNIR